MDAILKFGEPFWLPLDNLKAFGYHHYGNPCCSILASNEYKNFAVLTYFVTFTVASGKVY